MMDPQTYSLIADIIRRESRSLLQYVSESYPTITHDQQDTWSQIQKMINEEDVLAALDKPRAVYSLQMLLDPSSKSTEALQELLLRMRAAGKVKFDIKWADQAVQQHAALLVRLKVEPILDPLRSDLRFAKLMERVEPKER